MAAPSIPQAISEEAVIKQQSDYAALVSELGRALPEEIQQVLDTRELVELENGLCSEQVAKLHPWRTRISAKATLGIQKQIESIHSFVIQLASSRSTQ